MEFLRNRVKIIATLGPATEDLHVLRDMMLAGLDVVRLNFSHGNHEWHKQMIHDVRRTAYELGVSVAVIADLQGPKLRLTDFHHNSCFFPIGKEIILGFDQSLECDSDRLYVNCTYEVFSGLKVGNTILFDDGKIALEIVAIEDQFFKCVVKSQGFLSSRKGVNSFGGGLKLSALTAKDKIDLSLALELKVDFVALSFVKDVNDILELRNLIGDSQVKILAKFETSESISNYLAITEASDGIMVARGDLAVEVGAYRVPWIQKQLISAAAFYKKPAIVATQMMESMIQSSVPTRAEVSDVANAIIDGADAVMLSAETATGVDPKAVILNVANICLEANSHERLIHGESSFSYSDNVSQVIAWSAVESAHKLQVDYLVALTETGSTALMFSKFGVDVPILGLSRNPLALSHMAIYKHVTPIAFDVLACGPDVYKDVIEFLKKLGLVKPGCKLIITKGWALGVVGETNSMVVIGV